MTSLSTTPAGGVVILAAGRSRRFGADKRQHPMTDGRAMLTHSLEIYGSAFARCILVLRPDDRDPELPANCATALQIVRAADADRGMGHSLAAGLAAAMDWDYVFVALADMPWVSGATLAALRAALEHSLQSGSSATIVQPLCAGTPGHPVGFAARYLPELRQLTGDQGARSVLGRHPEQVQRIELGDPGTLRDLDTPEPMNDG